MIEITNLTKGYKQSTGTELLAVDEFNVDIAEGEVFGLIGSNGAGKSTTLLLLLDFLSPDSGEINIDGKTNSEYLNQNYVGYLPEIIKGFSFYKVWEFMEYNARLSRIKEEEVSREIRRKLELVEMLKHGDEQMSELSKGMLKRVYFAQLLLGSPELIILDEPTTGIDPLSIQQFRRAIQNRKGESTILISSHNLTELEKTCDRIGVMLKGRMEKIINLQELREENSYYSIYTQSKIRPSFDNKLHERFEDEILSTDKLKMTFRASTGGKLNEILSFLIEEGIMIKEAKLEYKNLEEVFNEIIKQTSS